MRLFKICFFLPLAITACQAQKPVIICPELVHYSPEQQKKLGEELQTNHDLEEIPRWLVDYVGLRAQVKACQK